MLRKRGRIDVTEELLDLYPHLDSFEENELFAVEKVQCMNGEAIIYSKSFWPVDIGYEFTAHDLSRKGLYQVLDEKGLIMEEADQTIRASGADENLAKELDIFEGAPLLIMERVGYTKGRQIEYSINYYRPDRYHYRIKLGRTMAMNGGGVLLVER